MYTPVFKGNVEKYTKVNIRINLWKVKPTHNAGDLYQGSYQVFLKCVLWYNTHCSSDKKQEHHFMAYYKRALHNLVVDMSWDHTVHKSTINIDDVVESEGLAFLDSSFFDIIQDAPSEVRDVLNMIMSSPKEVFQALGLHEKSARWSSSKFSQLLGIPKRSGLLLKVKDYLFEKANVEI
jgi:hypothetical protein